MDQSHPTKLIRLPLPTGTSGIAVYIVATRETIKCREWKTLECRNIRTDHVTVATESLDVFVVYFYQYTVIIY